MLLLEIALRQETKVSDENEHLKSILIKKCREYVIIK